MCGGLHCCDASGSERFACFSQSTVAFRLAWDIHTCFFGMSIKFKMYLSVFFFIIPFATIRGSCICSSTQPVCLLHTMYWFNLSKSPHPLLRPCLCLHLTLKTVHTSTLLNTNPYYTLHTLLVVLRTLQNVQIKTIIIPLYSTVNLVSSPITYYSTDMRTFIIVAHTHTHTHEGAGRGETGESNCGSII